MGALNENIHSCKSLQEDFNKCGICAFTFAILKVLPTNIKQSELRKEEQKFMDEYKKKHYVLYNRVKAKSVFYDANVDAFIKYINTRWLIPEGTEDITQYKIINNKNKNAIINNCLKYHVIPVDVRHITFNRIMTYMEEYLGYKTKRVKGTLRNNRKIYRLIIGFDPSKVIRKNKSEDEPV